MRIRIGIAALLLLSAEVVLGQEISFTSSRYESLAQDTTIFNKDTEKLEGFLTARFPSSTLRWAARSKEQPVLRKVTYEEVIHFGVKYLIVVFTARYDEPFNLMAIYQMRNDNAGWRVWRSRVWTSDYFGNSITTFKSGTRTLVLFKEGGVMPGDFGLASVFNLARWKGKTYVIDKTPENTSALVETDFPFRAVLGQNIQMHQLSQGSLNFMASESMYRYEDQIFQQTHEWQYNRSRNTFEPVVLTSAKVAGGN